MNKKSLALAALLAPLAAPFVLDACMPSIRTTSAFSSRFGDNDRGKIASVLTRVPTDDSNDRPQNSLGRPLLAAVLQGEQRQVAVYDLSTRQALWTVPLAATSTPEILGDALVVEVNNATHILDLATGRERDQIEHIGLDFAGAARDGDTLVMCFAAGLAGGSRRAGRVVAMGASGGTRWEHELGGLVGRPAARGGLAFVPWDRQSIAIIELATGREQARLRSTDDVLSWVQASGAGVLYGGRGIYRLTPDSATGTRAGSAYLANPLENVPGDPQVYRDAFMPTTGTRTARDKIRFAFRPVSGGDASHVALQNDSIYLAYYHDLLAVDAASGAVRWALKLDADIEGLTVTKNGVFIASGDGKVRGVDPATGALSVVAELNAQIGAIVFDVEGLALPTDGAAPDGGVREQLLTLVRDTDNRLVPFRGFLVTALARRDEEEVTRDLLDLYTQRSIPGQLRQSIATALQSRRTGAQYLVAALADHYDYLEGRQVPPLQVIAPTLVQMSARDAVPGLLAHLLDHETPVAVLPDVVTAVATLGEAAVVPALRQWVQLYKSDSAFRGDNAVALAAATEAIFRHGDAEARQWLRTLSQDASVNVAIKTRVEELFTREAATAAGAAAATTENERQALLQAELNRLHEAQSAVPQTLTDEAFDEVWNTKLDDIRECAQGAVTRNPALNQIRVVVTLRSELPRPLMQQNPPEQVGEGPTRHRATTDERLAWAREALENLGAQRSRVRLTTYSPNDPQLRACMDRAVQPLEFPVYREMRQEFRRVIDTRAARSASGQSDSYSGMGFTSEGTELPWWLVSAPTLEVENPQPATRPGTPATPATPAQTGADAGVRPRAPADAGTSRPDAGTQGTTGTSTQRPWWEE